MEASFEQRLGRLREAAVALAQPGASERDPRQVAKLIAGVVPADAVGYYVMQPPGTILEHGHFPDRVATAELLATVERIIPDHPMTRHVQRTGDPAAVRMGDLLSIRELKRLPVYGELYRPLGWNRYLAAYLPGTGAAPSLGALTLGRGGAEFSDTDRDLLDIARLVLAEAQQVARDRDLAAAAVGALETMAEHGPAAIVLDARHHIRVATRQAQSLLAAYFQDRDGGAQLPRDLTSWLAQHRSGRRPYVVRRDDSALTVTAARHPAGLVLLLTESRVPSRLTNRETQILGLVARGMTNTAIAHHLEISARTVEEHLARAFAKLGAGNRTEAVVKAFGRLDTNNAERPDR